VAKKAIKHLKRYSILWVVGLFLLVIIVGYMTGFRPGPGLTVVRVGTLIVTDLPKGSSVYVDQAPRGTTSQAQSLSVDLVPGTHTIIVDVPNEEPWEKIVTITSSKSTTVSPILVPKTPDPKKVTGSEATNAALLISRTKLPNDSTPLHMDCADVFASDNRVIVQAATTTPGCVSPEYLCTEGSCAPTIVFAPTATLHSVIPFPDRTDALIVAAGDWVYAIGLDPRSPQYFAPILHGNSPLVAPASSTMFYISDLGHLYSITF
jgi:hypothetical protein